MAAKEETKRLVVATGNVNKLREIAEIFPHYEVISAKQAGFEGEVEGYVVMDGPKYLGHMLYRVDGAVTQVLECGVEEKMFVDGAVRACVAAGENAGATSFRVNGEDEKLAEWKNVFFPEAQGDVPNGSIFHTCE